MGRDRWNHSYDHHNMVAGPAGTATVRTIWKTEDGITECYGTGTPPTTASTYAEGCIYHKANASSNDVLYVNNGTYASPSFEKVLSTGNVITEIENDHLATTLDDSGPSPLIWDAAPVLETILNPNKGFYFFDDLTQIPTLATGVLNAGLLMTQQNGGGAAANDGAAKGGVLKLDTGASGADDGPSVQWPCCQVTPAPGLHIYIEFRVKVGDDQGDVFIGLCDDAVTSLLGTGTAVVNQIHAGFFRDDGTTDADMGTQTVDSGDAITSADDETGDVDKTAYENFGMHIYGDGDTAGDYVKFYHKGTLVTTVTDADGGGDDGVPDGIICPMVEIHAHTTASLYLYVDWVRMLAYHATAGTVRE